VQGNQRRARQRTKDKTACKGDHLKTSMFPPNEGETRSGWVADLICMIDFGATMPAFRHFARISDSANEGFVCLLMTVTPSL